MQIAVLDILVVAQFRGGSVIDHHALFQDIAAVAEVQDEIQVLFRHDDGHAGIAQFADLFADLGDDQRGEMRRTSSFARTSCGRPVAMISP